ncbi:MAG: class I SAM-dependent methyltransferase [Promethearchaeota archaeon]
MISQEENEKKVNLRDQLKKFLIKGAYGFSTFLTFGLGRVLGIFDYLHDKAKKSSTTTVISSVEFTPDELVEKLGYVSNYIDAWIHLALECGIFEIGDATAQTLRTAPHVYTLLIDRNSMFYIGDTIGLFYYLAPMQEYLVDFFKTGKMEFNFEIPEESMIDAHKSSARWGELVERLFSNYFKEFCKKLKKQGTILEVGCGYGFNIEKWAAKYKKAQFVGIDIDSKAIKYTKNLIENHNWSNRVRVLHIPINEYAKENKDKFDLILLNHVLHEMDHDENYRRSVFNDLYSLLNNDGILLVGETMIPSIFEPKEDRQLFDIMHKFYEAGFARFYDKKSFEEFVNSTLFTKAEFIKKGGEYFWVVRK